MTAARGDRGVGVLLGVGTAVALAAGGWWWVASAPEAVPAPAAAEPSPGPVLDSLLSGDGTPGRQSVVLDTRTGAVVGPDEARTAAVRLRQALLKVPGDGTAVWSVEVRPGSRYLLTYVCDGPGAVEIQARGVRPGPEPEGLSTVCGDGALGSTEVTAADERLVISVSRPLERQGAADLTLQLITLG